MSFTAPGWFIPALPLLLYLWWLSRRSYAQLAPAAKWTVLVLRSLILILLLGALARPILSHRSDGVHLVFVVDVSQSISSENVEAAMDQIDKLAAEASRNHRNTQFSLIAFGRDARLLVSSSDDRPEWTPEMRDRLLYKKALVSLKAERSKLIGRDQSEVEEELKQVEQKIETATRMRDEVAGDRTDIESAMRLAGNCGSKDRRRTVYLFTDGNFNRGTWQKALSDTRDVAVHVVTLDRAGTSETALTGVTLPPRVRINEGFSARVRVVSNVATTGELVVHKDGYEAERREVEIAKGENTFDVEGLFFRSKGFHFIDAIIRAKKDTLLENNRSRSMVVVPGPVRVLYVEGDDSQISYLKSALELEGMQVDGRPAGGVPRELAELLGYDAFILSNVGSDKLSLEQMRMIRTYVEDFGGGFMMLGGDESFGLGGYFNTPIEEILPVRMPIQKDLNRPSLALVMVIDKSGSMSGAKIQLAKRAAMATTDVVNPRDQIGLVAFDGASRIILELTTASDKGTIAEHISSLNAGGGTFLYPALEDAQQQLQTSTARRKHVIVLSDGQTQGSGYEEMVRSMAADGVTLSTVGIGDGADMNLLESMAQAGGGRAYFTNDFYRIPQIFTREALRASKSMLIEKLIQPTALADDIALKEIDTDELPLLMGYVATTPREAAQTIIVSDTGDPILAKWRYGLGRTVAFTSEPKPRWAEDWIEWPDFAKFWSQLVRSITSEGHSRQIGVEITHRRWRDGVKVSADIRGPSGDFIDNVNIEATSIASGAGNSGGGSARHIDVTHVGPGRFEANIPQIEYGLPQQIVWKVGTSDQETRPTPYGFVYSFSPEYGTMGVAQSTLERMAARTNGEMMSVGQARLLIGGSARSRRVHLWVYLIAAALLLVPFDILCRRLG